MLLLLPRSIIDLYSALPRFISIRSIYDFDVFIFETHSMIATLTWEACNVVGNLPPDVNSLDI